MQTTLVAIEAERLGKKLDVRDGQMRQGPGEGASQAGAEAEHAAPTQHIIEPDPGALHQRAGAVIKRDRRLCLEDASRLQMVLQVASDTGQWPDHVHAR